MKYVTRENPGIIMLYTILAIITVLMIYYAITGIIGYYSIRIKSRTVEVFPQCQPPFNQLIDASQGKVCPDGNIYLSNIQMLVSSIPVPYLNACFTACTDGKTFSGCIDPIQQSSFNECVKLSQPQGCNSISNPVAHVGVNYYYVSSFGSC
jgi:hypothetical protein